MVIFQSIKLTALAIKYKIYNGVEFSIIKPQSHSSNSNYFKPVILAFLISNLAIRRSNCYSPERVR